MKIAIGLNKMKDFLRDPFGGKRWFIFLVCLLLIVIRLKWPDVKIDSNTIWLLIIATLVFLLPELRSIAPYIRTLKIAGIEIGLREDMDKLASELEKANVSLSDEGAGPAPPEIYAEVEEIIKDLTKDPRAALLLLASRLEEQIRKRLMDTRTDEKRRFLPVSQMVAFGVQEGIFPEEVLPAFREFWTIRNRVAHGDAVDVSNSTILSLVSLGTDLLKVLSATKPTDQ